MRRLLVVLGVIVVVIAGLVLAFRAWFPAERVRAYIMAEGSRRLGAEVRVGAIRPSLVPLGMRVEDLVVTNPAGAGAPPLVSLGEGALRVRFAPLFSKRIEVARATLDRLAVVMVLTPDGKPVLPRSDLAEQPGTGAAPGGAATKAPFVLLLSSLDLTGGSLRVLDPAHGKEMALEDIGAHSGMELAGAGAVIRMRGDGSARAFRSTDLATAGLVDGLRDLTVTWDLAFDADAGTIEITSARAGTGEVGVNVTGSIRGLPAAPIVDLVIPKQSFDLAKLIPLIPPVKAPDGSSSTISGSGTVGIEGQVNMLPDTAPVHRILITASDVAVKSSAAPAGITAAAGEVELRPATVDIRRFGYEMMGRRVSLAGLLHVAPDSVYTDDFRLETGRTRLALTAKATDLKGAKNVVFDARSPYLDLAEFMPPPAAAGAPPAGAGTTPGVPPAAPRPLIPPLPIGSARGTVLVEELVAPTLTVRNAHGDVSLAKNGLEATVRADRADIDKLPFTGIQGRVTVTPDGAVIIDGATARLFTGTVQGDVQMTVRGPGDLDYRIKAQAKELEANDFLTALTPVRNLLYGRMGMNMDFQGSGITREALLRSISANGDATVLAGRFVNLPLLERIATMAKLQELQDDVNFRDLQSHFEVKEGRVHTRDLAIDAANATWQASGSVGFDGSLDYGVALTLSKELTSRYLARAPFSELFVSADERMILDFKVGGTARDPKVSYDAKQTAARSGIRSAKDVLGKIGESKETKDLLDRLKKQIPGKR